MWGRLDVKIAERRVVLPNGQILNWAARVLGDFYQRDAPRRVQLSGAHRQPTDQLKSQKLFHRRNHSLGLIFMR
jgi:hypothetical protein